MIAKTETEITALREGGRRLGTILRVLAADIRPGISTAELNERAESLIRAGGDAPAFLNYTPQGARRPYPGTLCASVNEEVVHGIPNEKPRTLKEGDIIALDLGLVHDGLIVDAALTVGVGVVDATAKKLIKTAQAALSAGIKKTKVGNTIGDIGYAIGVVIEKAGFVAANELGGHAVGKRVHEEPFVPNWGVPGSGVKLAEGMVLALEPIVNEGTANIKQLSDGYTIVTRDGKRSSHFEHTILITKKGPEILTK
ncbi:type I methionyl aminopeptidase [Candidatus Kaiserbacteria bacterium RIFCSPHIGHO2_01_FULL_49_13]|uniref:Methionine aminopeptidase n=1 Tax=Candidatus Kaiserbacteria bacterium RIFCSPHIGHO2_01_FULL_49_13 TaxID=1798477 RepID=A0A1F6CEC3_9BACT|nr:MAG: type I methionyl aminopeptidase [Candidatus Kaiserbacteria bacterium RIFCSPHIGHO2_01_FULL_49_13]